MHAVQCSDVSALEQYVCGVQCIALYAIYTMQ